MLTEDKCKRILTLGPDIYIKGGISAVLKSYSEIAYSPFNFEKTTVEGSILPKALILLGLYFKLPYYIFFRNISIVHIHSASGRSFIRKKMLIDYLSLFNVAIIFHLHGAEFQVFARKYGTQKIKKTLSKCKKVVVLSQEWEKFMKEEIGHDNTMIINNIVPFPNTAGLPPKAKNAPMELLFLGVIGARKGVFDLLNIIATNKQYYKDKIMLRIGGNGEVKKLKQFIETNKLSSFVEFVGWIGGKEKIELLKSCDIYILPSYNEGLPISILEAMSYGKAIVSTRVGGIPSIVKNNHNGFLTEPGDLEGIKKAIDHLLENKEDTRTFGERSLMMSKQYLPDSVLEQLNRLYEEL